MFFQIRFDMSCTRKKQQPLSLTDGDGRSGNHYYTVTRTNVNILCQQHIQLFASTLSPLPNLFFFSTALPSSVVSWPWHDQGSGSKRIPERIPCVPGVKQMLSAKLSEDAVAAWSTGRCIRKRFIASAWKH